LAAKISEVAASRDSAIAAKARSRSWLGSPANSLAAWRVVRARVVRVGVELEVATIAVNKKLGYCNFDIEKSRTVKILESMLIASNFGLCATVGDKTVVKSPDWVYVPAVELILPGEIRRSYTPHAEGNIPAIVLEFISETEGG
jgi:hypothetical protein